MLESATALLAALGVSGGLCAEPQTSAAQTAPEWGARFPGDRDAIVAFPDSDYRALYEQGLAFDDFLAQAERRRKTWHGNYERGLVPDSLLDRARALDGDWRLLVVAEDWCGDSANTIPYVARLVESVSGLAMRVIDSEVGRQVMEDHPTSDGRAATPTVILLNAEFREAGCWVERPSTLQRWFQENEGMLEEDELYEQKYDWYDRDAGHETVREIVEMVEAAVRGEPHCAGVPADREGEGRP